LLGKLLAPIRGKSDFDLADIEAEVLSNGAFPSLCGPSGRDFTGTVIEIDGGWSAA